MEGFNETNRPETPPAAEKVHRSKAHGSQQRIDDSVVTEDLLKP